MESRRTFGFAILGVGCLAACDSLLRVDQKSSLRQFRISLPPEQTPALMMTLERFANAHGFAFSSDSVSSQSGTSTHFVLRRNDLRLVGLNPPSDHTEMRTAANGTPEAIARIDEGTFHVGVFAEGNTPTNANLNEVMSAFVTSVETVDGVSVIEQS